MEAFGLRIASFVDISASDAVHQESLAAIVSEMAAKAIGLVVVVEKLESVLVNPSGATRSRGVLLLVSLLKVIDVSPDEIGFLMVFFRDRSRDNPCVAETVDGLSTLLSRWSEKIETSAVEAMLVTLFAEVFVQGLDQPARNSVFRLMDLVITKAPAAAVSLNHDFVFGYLQMIDGERDPRNLLLIFSVTPKVLSVVPGWERLAEELFDVCACYYPINYKPRGENDPISQTMLVDALDKVMTCVPQFSSFYYTFMTEKLEGEHSHLWKSLVRSIAAFADGGRSFVPHAFVFWGALQADAFEGKDATAVQQACVAVQQLLAALSENLVTQSSGACSLDPLLDPLLRVCATKLQEPDSKDALVAGALLTAAARGSAEAARRVCAAAVPTLSRLTVDANSEALKEKMGGLLSDLARAAVELGVGLPRKSHPLFAHVEGLQAVALELCQHPTARMLRETGLALLCDLCFRTPLAAAEAQAVALSRVLEQGADATLAAVAGMDAALQTSLALPRLLELPLSDAALGGLCALRPEVVLPEPARTSLLAALLAMRDSQLAAAALGNLVNKGQVTVADEGLSAVQLAWLGRGLVLASDARARRLLQQVAEKCADPSLTALLLETVFGEGLEALSASSSHAVERSLGRQKAFCQLFPVLVERADLHAVGVLAGVVAPAALLGELPLLLPLLLGKVKTGSEDSSGLQGALMALSAVVKGGASFCCCSSWVLTIFETEAATEVSLHTDTLLKQAAGHCTHPDQVSFLL